MATECLFIMEQWSTDWFCSNKSEGWWKYIASGILINWFYYWVKKILLTGTQKYLMDKKKLKDVRVFFSFIEDKDHMIGLVWINTELRWGTFLFGPECCDKGKYFEWWALMKFAFTGLPLKYCESAVHGCLLRRKPVRLYTAEKLL